MELNVIRARGEMYTIITDSITVLEIYQGWVTVQDILVRPGRLRTTKLKKKLLQEATPISQSILFEYDRAFFLQRNPDGSFIDIRDGHIIEKNIEDIEDIEDI